MEAINLVFVLTLTLLSGYFSLRRLKQRNVTCVLYGLYFFFFGISNLLQMFFHLGYSRAPGINLSNEVFFPLAVQLKANIINTSTLLLLFFGEELLIGKGYHNYPATFSRRELSFFSNFLWIILMLSVVGFIAKLKLRDVPLSMDLLSSSAMRTEYRSATSGSPILIILANQLIGLIMVFNYLSLLTSRRFHFALGFIFTVFLVVASGTRSYMLYSLGPLLCHWIINKKFRRSHVAFGLVLLMMLSPVSEIIRNWRWLSRRNLVNFLKVTADLGTYTSMFTYPTSEFNIYTYYLNNAILLFPDEYGWLYGHTYRNLLLFWLPSNMSEKPKTIHLFRDAVSGESSAYDARSSSHPTFAGDSYMNFGYFFWLPPIFWGFVLSMLYIKSRKNLIFNILVGSSSVYFIAYFFRGSIYLGCIGPMFLALFLFIIGGLYKIVRASRLARCRPLEGVS